MLCDWQPHPLYFTWSFLIAGLLRTHTSLESAVHARALRWRHLAELALADAVCFHVFAALAARSLTTVTGVVNAWLLSLVVGYPLRAWAARRAAVLTGRRGVQHALLPTPTLAVAGTLAAAALASSLVLLLAVALLKFELQERGDALDAACYAWHVATFFPVSYTHLTLPTICSV